MADHPLAEYPWLARLRDRVMPSLLAMRHQIDRTGLFPDLKGESGSKLRHSVMEEGQLSKSYMLMSALSAGIATLGLLQSSTAVVIGAMLISPLMGPIAMLGFGFASLDGHQIRASVKVIAIGALIGILTGILLTWLSPIRNATPEIIARTEPTLLDLAVAFFSGMAGAYATVQQKGVTAIGVAIATALMPPLATVGYGIGVGNMAFTLGAFLLFLTNLAAIAFSFALVARLSGAARPMARVEITPRYVIAGLVAFTALATPLGVTLYRVTTEAKAQATVRRLLASELNLRSANIAQLDVRWSLYEQPSVDAVVVSPRYVSDAEQRLRRKLEAEWGEEPRISLQQVVAADIESQTQAIVSAAVERSAAGIARDVPPLSAIHAAMGLPTQAVWTNRTERMVHVVPFAADGWTLSDYRAIEQSASDAGDGWQVRVVPPVVPRLTLPLILTNAPPEQADMLRDSIWALSRWNVQGIRVAGTVNGNNTYEDQAKAMAIARFVVSELTQAGVMATAVLAPATDAPAPVEGENTEADSAETPPFSGVEIEVVRAPVSAPTPAQAPAQAPAQQAPAPGSGG